MLRADERRCVCCGFVGHWRFFQRAGNKAPAREFCDDWICRSYWKCFERGREAFRTAYAAGPPS